MAQLFPSETLLWRIVPKNKMQNKIQFRKSRSTWEQSCQSHPLTNIQTFICDFAREMTIFNRNACNYQTATRWDLPPYRFLIWLIDNVILNFVYLPVELILVFVTAIWHETPVDWNSHRLSTLYLEANRLTRCASHPKHLRHLLFSKKWLFIWPCLVCKLNPPTNPHSLTL